MRNSLSIFVIFLISIESYAYTKSECSGYDQPSFQNEYKACLKIELAKKAQDAGVDCVDCFVNEQIENKPSDWVLALSAVAQPLAYLGSAYIGAKYQYKSQQAWADAYKNAYSQCTNRFNSYLDYSTQMGANPLSASDAQSLMNTCNGNSYSNYSGYSGLIGNGYGGSYNPMIANGYSSGFLGGMNGPYYGGMSANSYGLGLGTGLYSNLNTGLYGQAGMGIYGNMGMMSSPYGLNYASPYAGVYGANMGYAGLGINPYGGYNASYGVSPYAAGNLNASFGLNIGASSTGFSF